MAPGVDGCVLARTMQSRRVVIMHELSICQGIVESVCEAVPDGQVLVVTVEIGRLSGVVPEAIRFCFDACARGTRVEGARLDIREVPGRGRCGSCDQQLDMDELLARCACGNPFLEIVRGRELRIRSVEVN
jgi:hydrogenase nickel incorporation protein HypA/HybF